MPRSTGSGSGRGSPGKSAAHTDTYHGHFVKLVPDRQVVEALTDVDGGTEVVIAHDGIPDAIPADDNETGTRMALASLARLVEAG